MAGVQGLWYFVQPPLASLGLAASIASEAASKELWGAPLLNMLHAKAASVSGIPSAPCLSHQGLTASDDWQFQSELCIYGHPQYMRLLPECACEYALADLCVLSQVMQQPGRW